MERPDLMIAKVIGQPIDGSLSLPFELSLIADLETAEPGEDVYAFTSYDDNTDTVYTAADSGELTSNKKSPSGATGLTFVGLQSDLAYVTVNEILDAKDQSALARKKAAITRSMDKEEAVRIIAAIQAIAAQEYVVPSGQDLYLTIVGMMHMIEDYADNFVLLAGKTVSEKWDTYDRDNVTSFQYNISFAEQMKVFGIRKIKVVGSVQLDSGSYSKVLADASCILVGLNSQLKQGRPILIVRRKISPEIAQLSGINPDEAFRLISVAQTPQVINNHKNILGYGVFGYESVIEAIVNSKAISWAHNVI